MRISDWSSDVCSSDLILPGSLKSLVVVDLKLDVVEKNLAHVHSLLFLESDIIVLRTAQHPVSYVQSRCEKRHHPACRTVAADRKSVVKGKSVSVRVALGGRRIIRKNNSITLVNSQVNQ